MRPVPLLLWLGGALAAVWVVSAWLLPSSPERQVADTARAHSSADFIDVSKVSAWRPRGDQVSRSTGDPERPGSAALPSWTYPDPSDIEPHVEELQQAVDLGAPLDADLVWELEIKSAESEPVDLGPPLDAADTIAVGPAESADLPVEIGEPFDADALLAPNESDALGLVIDVGQPLNADELP